jgi:hypothetical protein
MVLNIEGYDPVNDPAVIQLAESISQNARWGMPNVMIEYDELPPEIARLTPLFQERVERLAQEATQAIGAQVELVVAGATIVSVDEFHAPLGGPPDLQETRASRAHAERVALARRILEVAAQVETATEVHRRQVDALRKAAVDAAHHLNVVLHQVHRFADEFTFALPDTLDVDDAVYEIGMRRVHDALNTRPDNKTDEETAA